MCVCVHTCVYIYTYIYTYFFKRFESNKMNHTLSVQKPSLSFPTWVEHGRRQKKMWEGLRLWKWSQGKQGFIRASTRDSEEARLGGEAGGVGKLVKRRRDQSPTWKLGDPHLSTPPGVSHGGRSQSSRFQPHMDTPTISFSCKGPCMCTEVTQDQRRGTTRGGCMGAKHAPQIPSWPRQFSDASETLRSWAHTGLGQMLTPRAQIPMVLFIFL